MASSADIEEQIVRLHEEGKTTREISKEVHKNFTYIGAVLRSRFPDEYGNNDNSKTISKESKALKLFSKGKDPVHVATKLDMKPEDVKNLYLELQSLQGLPSLTDMHNELGNTLPSFIQAYKKIVQNGIGIEQANHIILLMTISAARHDASIIRLYSVLHISRFG